MIERTRVRKVEVLYLRTVKQSVIVLESVKGLRKRRTVVGSDSVLLRLVNSSKEKWRETVRCWTAVEADWWNRAEETEGCVSFIRDDRSQDKGMVWNLMQSWIGRELTDDFPRGQCVGDEGKLRVLRGRNGLVDGVANWIGVDGAWRNAVA